MNIRFAYAVAAVALATGAYAPPASARTATTNEASFMQSTFVPRANNLQLGARGGQEILPNDLLGAYSSAKGGNAENNNFSVPNYGNTSGGYAR